MKKTHRLSLLTTTLVFAGLMPGLSAADSVADAVKGGKAGLEFRLRHENVDQDGPLDTAKATTLRTRLNYKTGTLGGFALFAEFDNISVLGGDDFNDTRNGETHFATVADPDGTDLNQAYLEFSGFDKTLLRYGRQRIKLDNERFIGPVGWRQNEQTFDSFSVENKSLPDTTLTYAYIDKVQRIFGPDSGSPTEEFEGSSHVVNGKYEGFGFGALSVYDYRLDFDNAAGSSSNTFGARLDGKTAIAKGLNLSYAVDVARQHDVGDNSVDYDADYRLLEVGLKTAEGYSVGIGQEILGSDGGKSGGAFQTPLATGHKFQGWADKFITTPKEGIDDRYVSGGVPVLGLNTSLIYHDYRSDVGGLDLGSEWNLSVVKKFGKTYELMFKYADYEAEDLTEAFTDTRKIWLMASAAY
ncbi:MAG: alginate export family protein [Gammaproteobacteria bacterium]|nr:alginate export family protein [Gammaproteobacteria bacterium]